MQESRPPTYVKLDSLYYVETRCVDCLSKTRGPLFRVFQTRSLIKCAPSPVQYRDGLSSLAEHVYLHCLSLALFVYDLEKTNEEDLLRDRNSRVIKNE